MCSAVAKRVVTGGRDTDGRKFLIFADGSLKGWPIVGTCANFSARLYLP
jgi:hypothetical protein